MNSIDSQINQTSVFLVSGGAKGITAQCVIELAKQKKCKFILLGRSSIAEPEPIWARSCSSELELKKRLIEHLLKKGENHTPVIAQKAFNAILSKREIEKTLFTIKQAGGQAEYLSVDVTDAIALQLKLTLTIRRTGSVTGIIHGAGNLADKRNFEAVYNTKVKGLENLLYCVSASQLHYLVLFSSMAGFDKNIYQPDYMMANEILNKSAYLIKRYHPNCHVVTINWGSGTSGMVFPEFKKVFAEQNTETIPIEIGTKMLVDELDPANPESGQVVIGTVAPTYEALNPELQTFRIHRRLTLAANPFLREHVMSEHPILPVTCVMSWIINTCEQFYPGYKFFSCANFKVLKKIVFDETLASDYILDLKEIAKTNSNEIEFGAKIWSKTKGGKIRYHFITQLKLLRKVPRAPTYNSFNLALQTIPISKTSFYQNGVSTLFHSPCFQGVDSILSASHEKLNLKCILPSIGEQQQGQFPVQTFNPYIVDIQVHSTWIWLQHFYQRDCLLSEIQEFEQFAAIPFNETFYVSCEVKSKIETSLVADIIAHDIHGQIYSTMLGARGTILPMKQKRI